jgi:hypothetical protein
LARSHDHAYSTNRRPSCRQHRNKRVTQSR